jgi:hypothetical protein
MVTKTGEFLFGQSLDFAWCHMAVQAHRLGGVVPHIRSHDMGLFAELVIALRDEISTIDVDWLSWEDPFIFGRDPQDLRSEREGSASETRKRLGYVIPMLKILEAASTDHVLAGQRKG